MGSRDFGHKLQNLNPKGQARQRLPLPRANDVEESASWGTLELGFRVKVSGFRV